MSQAKVGESLAQKSFPRQANAGAVRAKNFAPRVDRYFFGAPVNSLLSLRRRTSSS